MGKSAGLVGGLGGVPDWFWQDAGVTIMAIIAGLLLFAVWSLARTSRR